MALNKHWVLNENYQPLFKVDFDVDSADYDYLFSLNGGIAYGISNPVEYPESPYAGKSDFLVKKLSEPLTDFKTKINSLILGTYNNTSTSAQDNQVTYLSSWENNLYNFFTSDEQFRRVNNQINYGLPYGIGDASKASEGYWGIDFKVKTSEYYTIMNYIKDSVNDFYDKCVTKNTGYSDSFCVYVGHIGGIYEYMNGYNTDFDISSNLLDTKSGSKKCFPILWWNCVSNGVGKLNAISGTTTTSTNISNLYYKSVLCLYYNKNTGMCICIFFPTSSVSVNTTDKFNALKNFLLRCVELQARVGYIVV